MSKGLTGIFSWFIGSFFSAGRVRDRGGNVDLLMGGKDPPIELPRF